MKGWVIRGRCLLAEVLGIGEALLMSFCLETRAGGLAVSQVITLGHPVHDYDGEELLPGNSPASISFGVPHVPGALVQILQTSDEVVYPPSSQGHPDPRNVLLATGRIGQGRLPYEACPGTFSTALSPRPGGESRIFVRVFNRDRLETSSYYRNSEIFTVSS